MLARRQVLGLVGGACATLSAPSILRATVLEEIEMRGSARGERVWFRPLGLAVAPGTTIRFINRDPGNAHTATAFHPDLHGRTRRIPEAAEPWDSDFLMPGEQFELRLIVPGVYDYYCLPHEAAGMIGRIVVGEPTGAGWSGPSAADDDLAPAVLEAFPAISEILARGRVEGDAG